MPSTQQKIPRGSPLLTALDEAAVALAIFSGPDLVLRYATPAYLHLFPSSSMGMSARDVLSSHAMRLMADSAQRVLESGAPSLSTQVTIDDHRLCDISFSPMRNADRTVGVLVVAVDVTGHVRALSESEAERERLLVLDHATKTVAAEAEPRRELAALAESVVPGVADACAIYLWHPPAQEFPNGSLTRLVCVIDPHLRVDPPRAGVTVTMPPDCATIQAVRQRRTVVAKTTLLGRKERWLAALPVTSLVAVPVEVNDAVHAVVTFVTAEGRQPFQASDISLLREITERATVAVSRAMQLQRTTEVSLALQRSFLSAPPALPGLEIAVRYRPAGPGLEIGGDWYDALMLPDDGLGVAIGDVVGHDLPAATTMAQLRSMLQALACQRGSSPGSVLTELNQITGHLGIGSCATLIYGEVTRAAGGQTVFRWANAGHPAPLLLGETPTFLTGAPQPLLGLSSEPYLQDSCVLDTGSTLLFFTDGLVEPRRHARDPLALLADHVSGLGDLSPADLVAALDDWAPRDDDLALLAMRLNG